MSDFKNSSVRFLTGADFEDDAPEKLREKQCMIVLFYADWCGHCQNLKPVYAKFADAAQFLDVAAVDTVANETLMNRLKNTDLKITGFPTIIKYSNGEPIGEIDSRDYAGLMNAAMNLCNERCECHMADRTLATMVDGNNSKKRSYDEEVEKEAEVQFQKYKKILFDKKSQNTLYENDEIIVRRSRKDGAIYFVDKEKKRSCF